MGKLVSFGVFLVGALVIVDVLKHPAGTAAASNGIKNVSSPFLSALTS